ncbi:MAG: transposase [Patescibacteria group bacterium]|nr:transposase [Patescibacteria group bacterium]
MSPAQLKLSTDPAQSPRGVLSWKLKSSREDPSVGLAELEKIEATRRDLLINIHCCALIPNHFHLLAEQLKDNGISTFMNKIGGYAYYFNQKYHRKGRLFQDNFKAVHIESEEQLKTAFVYIHTNPASLIEPGWKEKGIRDADKVMEFLENYKWSSFGDYVGKPHFPSLTSRDFLTEIMGGPEGCRKFVRDWLKYKERI